MPFRWHHQSINVSFFSWACHALWSLVIVYLCNISVWWWWRSFFHFYSVQLQSNKSWWAVVLPLEPTHTHSHTSEHHSNAQPAPMTFDIWGINHGFTWMKKFYFFFFHAGLLHFFWLSELKRRSAPVPAQKCRSFFLWVYFRFIYAFQQDANVGVKCKWVIIVTRVDFIMSSLGSVCSVWWRIVNKKHTSLIGEWEIRLDPRQCN